MSLVVGLFLSISPVLLLEPAVLENTGKHEPDRHAQDKEHAKACNRCRFDIAHAGFDIIKILRNQLWARGAQFLVSLVKQLGRCECDNYDGEEQRKAYRREEVDLVKELAFLGAVLIAESHGEDASHRQREDSTYPVMLTQSPKDTHCFKNPHYQSRRCETAPTAALPVVFVYAHFL